MKNPPVILTERGTDAAALSNSAKPLTLAGRQSEVLLDPPKIGHPLRVLFVRPGSPKKLEARNLGPVREIRVYTEDTEYTFKYDTN